MRWMFVKGRLKPGATPDQAGANLRLIGKQLQTSYVQTNKDRDVSVVPTRTFTFIRWPTARCCRSRSG